jgi:hypothetical protein
LDVIYDLVVVGSCFAKFQGAYELSCIVVLHYPIVGIVAIPSGTVSAYVDVFSLGAYGLGIH